MNKICYGCGSKLQSEDNTKEGYVPKEKLEEAVYCQRCFKIMHYGLKTVSDTPKNIDNIINSINKDHKFVIFLVDFLNLNKAVLDIYHKLTGNKMLLISKYDLIPRSINDNGVKLYLKNNYNVTDDLKFISTLSGYGINGLLKYLEDHHIKETYIVGLSNSGKSTLINKIMELNNSKLNKITTSYVPNTTLDFIRLQINPNLLIIDSPGFIINGLNFKTKDSEKTEIKPKTYQMRNNETIYINDMYLNFVNNTSITLYLNNDIKSFKDYKQKAFSHSFDIPDNSDIVISGVGFINVKKGGKVYILNIPLEMIEIRKSLFEANNE
jgi:ribosome biogenesis GTPase A